MKLTDNQAFLDNIRITKSIKPNFFIKIVKKKNYNFEILKILLIFIINLK